MKKTLKKLLTIVLAVTMLTGLISVTAFADDGDASDAYADRQAKYEENMQNIAENAGSDYEPFATVSAATTYVTSDGFQYTLSGNSATITGYIGKLYSITVPANVDGHPVVTIECLYDHTLTSITVSQGIKEISDGAFLCNASLTYVYIPSSIEVIGSFVFDETTSLQTIDVNPGNPYYTSVNGILFNKAKDTLICYPAGKTASSYSVPTTVKVLDGWAFACAKNLSSVTLPSGLDEIDLNAFEYCTSLASISIPESVTDISLGAFSYCTSLQTVTIPKGVTYYYSDAFSYCSNLKSINVSPENALLTSIDGVVFSKDTTQLISYPCGRESSYYSVPSGTTEIYNAAFEGCTTLKCINLPNGLKEIDGAAFYECTSLQDIAIPLSLTTVGVSAFDKCKSLTDVYYRGTEAQRANITATYAGDPFHNATWHYNCSEEFADVSTTEWFYDPVIFVKNAGIMTGLGGTNKFGPAQPLQREQFAIILWRLEDCPATAYESKFPDVPDGTWFTEPIMWAYKNGVITGYASGNFGVGDNITREQFAVMFFRYAKNIRHINMKNYADISTYPDVAQVSDWAYEAMQWAVGNGIITGKQGKYLDPAGNAQRCEGATMIQRFMDKFPN